MKKGFYRKLAWSGMQKNRRLYIPYILTCMGMVMMFYIMAFLTESNAVGVMRGGGTLQTILHLGSWVIGIFSLIFLFYTNSFLVRRRKKEFGLYNILGMGKRNLARVIVWESVIIAAFALLGGLGVGILFSKFAELGLINILKADVSFELSLSPGAVLLTGKVFLPIFGLIFLNTLRQIHLANPIELLRSENAGEKPPKANWLLALVGVVLLAGAYWLAVSIENPLSAIMWFFVAVVMVILATYLLFVAGSVAFCKLLQKNKTYYYKTNHFVSVSSMVYRMKRNGAGLASICILCTMVLVMISSTMCLYMGAEDSLRTRYPRNINLDVSAEQPSDLPAESLEELESMALQAAQENGQTPVNILSYQIAAMAAYVVDGHVQLENPTPSAGLSSYENLWQVFMIPLEDYNRLMGQNETLQPGECMIYTTKADYTWDTVTFGDGDAMTIKKVVPDFADNGVDAMQIVPSLYIFVPAFEQSVEPLKVLSDSYEQDFLDYHWIYGYDLDCDDDTQIQVQKSFEKLIAQWGADQKENSNLQILWEGVATERQEFYGLYGGLFFLGILLGVVFLFAAVLIMYYKQISEGYEDQSRFEIMQKVGMTKREIRRSINSQVLTVFFLPLLLAGVHLTFAFPLIQKMLLIFGLNNQPLLIGVTAVSFLVFALFYVLVYRITSGAYYNIVSGAKGERNE